MANGTCSIEDCNAPVLARGWCSRHYTRWKRTGDPLLTRVAIRLAELKRNGCNVDGCAEPYSSSGYCARHYNNFLRHGDPTPRKRGEVRDGKRICPRCQEDLPLAAYSRPTSACDACESVRVRQWRDENRDRVRSYSLAWQKRHPDKVRDRQARRRARLKVGSAEAVMRREVFDRDGWRCQICGLQIPKSRQWPDRLSASLDHKLPLALGGAHALENCQAAHLGCNMAKGDRLAA